MIDYMPVAPDPAVDPPGQFSQKAAAFALAMRNLPVQINQTVGGLTSLAAGGAYALVYRNVNNLISNGGPNGGVLSIAATQILVDTKDASGFAVGSILEDFNSSTSAVKGTIRIQKIGDPSVWATFNATFYTRNGGGLYGAIDCRITASSNGAQFGENALVMLFFQRTGDKGEFANLQSMVIRDQRSQAAAAQSLTALAWTTRVINTVISNSIPGASLSGNLFTLPAGTFLIDVSAPACGTSAHQIRLFNVTDNTQFDIGTGELVSSVNSMSNRSTLRTVITITSPKAFRIDHWSSANVVGGSVVNATGSGEVYTELRITKVA